MMATLLTTKHTYVEEGGREEAGGRREGGKEGGKEEEGHRHPQPSLVEPMIAITKHTW